MNCDKWLVVELDVELNRFAVGPSFRDLVWYQILRE